MLYWETADQDPSLDASMLEWAAIWKALPKVVFSSTLPSVLGNARLASGGLAQEIERWRAEPGEGDIAIGGAALAAEAAALGLIDEYRARVYPVLLGGGIPFFDQRERRVDLELVETRTFSLSVVYLRYRVARERARAPSTRKNGAASGVSLNHPAQFSRRAISVQALTATLTKRFQALSPNSRRDMRALRRPGRPGVVAQRTRRWTSVIVTSGSPILDGSRPLATATLPMAGRSVDWTNCLMGLD